MFPGKTAIKTAYVCVCVCKLYQWRVRSWKDWKHQVNTAVSCRGQWPTLMDWTADSGGESNHGRSGSLLSVTQITEFCVICYKLFAEHDICTACLQATEGSTVSSIKVKIAGILISTVKVLAAPTSAEADRCSWVRWLTVNNRRQSIVPKLDSRPCLEGARCQVPDKATHLYSALPYPSVTHTLAHIINQTPPLPGLAQ